MKFSRLGFGKGSSESKRDRREGREEDLGPFALSDIAILSELVRGDEMEGADKIYRETGKDGRHQPTRLCLGARDGVNPEPYFIPGKKFPALLRRTTQAWKKEEGAVELGLPACLAACFASSSSPLLFMMSSGPRGTPIPLLGNNEIGPRRRITITNGWVRKGSRRRSPGDCLQWDDGGEESEEE